MGMFNVREVRLWSGEAPCTQGTMGQHEAADPHRPCLTAGHWPVGVGAGDRHRLVGRAQATAIGSGGAGRVAHASSSGLSQGTHARDDDPISHAFRRPSCLG